MRLDTIARKILPTKLRQSIGCWSLNVACHNTALLKAYMKVLHGYSIDNISARNGYTQYKYNSHIIKSPYEGTDSFLEVFIDEVYDSVISPKENGICIDVGAYVGMWSIKASTKASQVIAIEAAKNNIEWLIENTDSIKNITCLNYAVSNKDGYEILYINKTSSCNSITSMNGFPVQVPCRKLDTIAKELKLDKVDFVKVDAEGAELKVLQGAEEILKGNVKLSIASYHDLSDGHPEYTVIESYLKDRGFKVMNDSGLRRYIYATKAN